MHFNKSNQFGFENFIMEKFKSIPELIQSLNHLALRINKGSVGLEEFENTLSDARELYERLVILRYKAIEDRNLMGMTSAPKADETNAPVEPLKVEEPTLAARQISLIDSIEEIARETEPEADKKEYEPKVEPPSPAIPEPPVRKEKPVVSEVVPPAAQKPSIAQQTAFPDSLAEKLSQTKIDDLTVAIGLNQKFRFIKELFKGDSSAYNEAVKALNQCDNLEEAQHQVKNELMKSYEWDEEDQVTMTFLNLIERRYQ